MNIMKQQNLWLSVLLMGSMTTFISCSDDDGGGTSAPALEIESIMANGTDLETGENTELDLNAATAAEDVPLDATITIEFAGDVDASTATSSNINLTNGSTTVDAAVSASGSTVTLDPTEELERGTDYTLNITSALKADDGGSFATVTRSFKTAGRAEVTPPQADSQVAYWSLDGNADATVGDFETVYEQVTYTEDRFGFMSGAAKFDGATDPGTGDIIEIQANEAFMTPSRTISVWFMVDEADYTGSRFLMGQAVEKGFFAEIGGGLNWLKYATNHKLHPESDQAQAGATHAVNWGDAINGGGGGGEEGEVLQYNFEGDVTPLLHDKWTNLVMTYDAESGIKTLYIDGVKMREEHTQNNQEFSMIDMELNDAGVEDIINANLALGYAASRDNAATDWAKYETATNTFKGLMDDLRIFNVALSADEVSTLYDAEKP